jgi:hypothetical protein
MKLVPDQSQRAAEKEILEGLGFTVIENTPASFAQAPRPTGAVSRTKGRKKPLTIGRMPKRLRDRR